jgi:serine/threonine protein kinase
VVAGSRPSSKGKPLHWTSCMKIAEDAAAGLLHLHQSGIVHGNLKPSNVLLGADFESCLTDYGLVPTLLLPDLSSSSLLYRAPEASHLFTPASDVYSLGVLLLELLTGRPPFQDLLQLDIPSWVRAVRDEERETDSSVSAGAGGAEQDKLAALTDIAAACVATDPARRPTTPEVLRMVREARAEAMSSNSSDRSPTRDAMLAAAQQQFIESFTDRD